MKAILEREKGDSRKILIKFIWENPATQELLFRISFSSRKNNGDNITTLGNIIRYKAPHEKLARRPYEIVVGLNLHLDIPVRKILKKDGAEKFVMEYLKERMRGFIIEIK